MDFAADPNFAFLIFSWKSVPDGIDTVLYRLRSI